MEYRWKNIMRVRGFRRSVVTGVVIAFVAFLLHSILGMVHWWSVFGYILIGMTISFACGSAEQLWWYMIASMVRNRRSLIAYVTRMPFWYMAGGAGYVIGMLVSRRLGLMAFYDIPVKPLFTFGGRIGVAIQLLLQAALVYFPAGNSQEHSTPDVKR